MFKTRIQLYEWALECDSLTLTTLSRITIPGTRRQNALDEQALTIINSRVQLLKYLLSTGLPYKHITFPPLPCSITPRALHLTLYYMTIEDAALAMYLFEHA